jgi:DUF4097 and DUF4098 domain-containing protein YvlB
VTDVSGHVQVNAPFSRITGDRLAQGAQVRTAHAEVRVLRSGRVDIEAPHSEVKAENIEGDASITSSHRNIRVRSVAGELRINGQQSSVTAENVRGPIEINSAHGGVLVNGFQSAVRIKTSYRPVRLVAESEPVADIDVENSHGEIELILPQSSVFQLEALSRNGRVKQEGFQVQPASARESLSLTLGLGGPRISLRTSFKTVKLQAGRSSKPPQLDAKNNAETRPR